ncbi:chymotrypsin-like elastase family member 2A [Hyalella azteca]|uniref:Chymotrypsin-like elastase family member 2A n=1 Tax=Hyalella azteca TaxID=294128 RepID=A0A8B7NI93_HYAAZ|nr:chymotrypsin-like elastase family member 2A [Hyalella azteca]
MADALIAFMLAAALVVDSAVGLQSLKFTSSPINMIARNFGDGLRTNQEYLRLFWSLYEAQFPVDSQLAVSLQQVPHVQETEGGLLAPKCGGNIEAPSIGRYRINFGMRSSSCLYSVRTGRRMKTSVECPDVPTVKVTGKSASCVRDSVDVHESPASTTILCGPEKMLTIARPPSPKSESSMTFIACVFIVESTESGGKTNVPETAENSTQICPLNCGVSEVTASGNFTTRIVGGHDALPGEFPWQTYIISKISDEMYDLCGGSIINSRHVLTAAHCFKKHSWSPLRFVAVVAGLHSLDDFNDTYVQKAPAAKIILHPEYKFAPHVQNDIAIIRLARDIKITSRATPVCLAAPDTIYDNRESVVTGFGVTALTNNGKPDLAHVLKKAAVTIVQGWECQAAYLAWQIHVNPESQVCTRGFLQESCQGDSGGPVVVRGNTGRYEQVGIVSFGIGCTDDVAPSVNTRVAAYRLWIAAQSKEGFCF